MMFPRRHLDRYGTDTGASIVEMSSLIVMAAILLGGFAVLVRSKLAPGVDQAVCTLFDAGDHCRDGDSPDPLADGGSPDPDSTDRQGDSQDSLLKPRPQPLPSFDYVPQVKLKKSDDAKNARAVRQLAVDCGLAKSDLGDQIPDGATKRARRPDKCFFCPGDPTPGIHDRMNTCENFERKPDTYKRYVTKKHYPNNSNFNGDSPGLDFNCSSSDQSTNYQATDTQGTTNSVEVGGSVGADFEDVLWKLFKAKMEISVGYSHTWTKSHTYSVRKTITTAPGKVGWVSIAETRQKVRGVYVMNFGSPYNPVGDDNDKHYQWMITNAVVDSPDVNGATKTVFNDRDMTPHEEAEFCDDSDELVRAPITALSDE